MTASLPLTLLVFFASGFAALLYQVIWQRMLAIFSGTDVYSATVIVAAFMAGLGIGTLAGGHIADRVTRRTSLILFSVAELAVGLFGAFSASLYYGYLYEQLGTWQLGRGSMGVLLFGSLLWPTFFMGASLPLLARAVTDRIERAALTVGALYGFNTLGAACGALVSTWLLVPYLGLEGGLRVGVWLNAGCAVVLLPVALRAAMTGEKIAAPRRDSTPPGRAERTHFPWWLLAYGLAGFIALSYEIVWFRLLGIVMKSTAFTFGTLLTLYLAGIGLGAVAGSTLAARARQPERLFLTLQAAAGLSAALLLVVFVWVADDIRALAGYFAAYEPLNVRESIQTLRSFGVPANFLRLYIAVPLLLVVPPTLLMGCAFPVLQRVVQRDPARIGRHVGWLLLANILGGILGTILTGWLSLGLLGTAGTLRLLAVLSGIFLVCAWRHRGTAGIAAAVATAAIVAFLVPDAATLWARLHGTEPQRMVFAEDNTGLSVIRADREDFQGPKVVFVNGVGQSVLPYGDIHTALGALPVLVHPNPRNVAIIGLGSGDTVYAAAARSDTARVVSIEIVGSQLTTLRAVAARDGDGGLQALLRDPRVEHRVGDGRAFLMRSGREFDVIEADALRPTSAYSGNLYSEAYFTLLRNRLRPHGLAATWVPTQRVHDTFIKVFPYVVSVPGIMLGSSDPIDFTPATIVGRLAEPRIRDHFSRAGVDIGALMQMYVNTPAGIFGPDFNRATLTDVNTDLFPRDEFDLSGARHPKVEK